MTRKRNPDPIPLELPINQYTVESVEDYTGKIVVLRRSSMREPYASQDRRLYVTGGFGAKAHTIGRAVFGISLLDGEEARWDRGDIQGLAVDQTHSQALTTFLDSNRGL